MSDKSTKELMHMSPDEAIAELERMHADPDTVEAYMSKYGKNGYRHKDVVQRVTILVDIIGGDDGGFHPYLDAQMKFDPRSGQWIEDKEASRAEYEQFMQEAQSKRLAKQGITLKTEIDDQGGKDTPGDEKVRSTEELKRDKEFMKVYMDRYNDPAAHSEAVQTMAEAYARENPEPEAAE